VKAAIEAEGKNSELESAFIAALPLGDGHFSNLLKIDTITIGDVVLVENKLTGDVIDTAVIAEMKAQISEAAIAAKLNELTGLTHETAKNLTVAEYLKEGKKFDLVITFETETAPASRTITIELVK